MKRNIDGDLDLSVEEIYGVVEMLATWWYNNANEPTMKRIWGNSMGFHLWEKLKVDFSNNFLRFWGSLDEKNREIFVMYFQDHIADVQREAKVNEDGGEDR